MTTKATPTTPYRPPRSLSRVNTTSTLSSDSPDTPSDDVLATPQTPSTDNVLVVDPSSPETPTPTGHLTRSKSISSLKRKPVPLNLAEASIPALPATARTTDSSSSIPVQSARTGHSALPTPPTYALEVDPPLASPTPSYPSYPPPPHERPRRSSLDVGLSELGLSLGLGTNGRASEDLPVYSQDGKTESDTLARQLWRWGWLCPLLWGIGMTILWSPLQHDTEADPQKQQRMDELCVVMRKTELKYARRCMYGFVIFCTLVAIIIAAVVILKMVH